MTTSLLINEYIKLQNLYLENNDNKNEEKIIKQFPIVVDLLINENPSNYTEYFPQMLEILINQDPNNIYLIGCVGQYEYSIGNVENSFKLLDTALDLDNTSIYILQIYITLLSNYASISNTETNTDALNKALNFNYILFDLVEKQTNLWYDVFHNIIKLIRKLKLNNEKKFMKELLDKYTKDGKLRYLCCKMYLTMLNNLDNKRKIIELLKPIVDGEILIETDIFIMKDIINIYNRVLSSYLK